MRYLLSLALLLLCAVAASAQAPPVNPTTLLFDSVDHAQAIRYEVGYFMGSATTPVQVTPVPVAAIGGSAAAGRSLAFPRPVFGTFTTKLRLIYLDAASAENATAWSGPTVPFVLSPLAPAIRGLQ